MGLSLRKHRRTYSGRPWTVYELRELLGPKRVAYLGVAPYTASTRIGLMDACRNPCGCQERLKLAHRIATMLTRLSSTQARRPAPPQRALIN